MQFTIHDITFKSKLAAKAFIRERLNPTTFDPKDPYLFALLERHREFAIKIGSGFAHFELEYRTFGTPTWEPLIVRVDGSKIDFSWVKCLSGSWMKPEDKLRSAMREAVSHQIQEFRDSFNERICSECSQYIVKLHIDHSGEESRFENLVLDFLVSHHPAPTRFDDCPKTYRAKFKECDLETFTQPWQEYHKKHARLRGICAPCNLKRG